TLFRSSLDVGICSRAKAIHIQLDLPTGHYIGFEYLRDAQIDGAECEQRDRRVAAYRNRSLKLQICPGAVNGGLLQCQHTSAVIRSEEHRDRSAASRNDSVDRKST